MADDIERLGALLRVLAQKRLEEEGADLARRVQAKSLLQNRRHICPHLELPGFGTQIENLGRIAVMGSGFISAALH